MVTLFLAATRQLYEWFSPSVCLSACLPVSLSVCPSVRPSIRPSVCLSVRLSVTPFSLCYHHRIIIKISGVITNDRSDVHSKSQGQRSKVKVTELKTQFSRFRAVTPVWIHMWLWNHVQSLMFLRIGEVPYCFSRSSVKFQGHMAKKTSHLTKIGRFRTVTPVWIHLWLRNDTQSLK